MGCGIEKEIKDSQWNSEHHADMQKISEIYPGPISPDSSDTHILITSVEICTKVKAGENKTDLYYVLCSMFE